MMMQKSRFLIVGACFIGLAGCVDIEAGPGLGFKEDKSFDRGFDKKPLSELQAGIWVDPNGCDHWIIDDGVEGYLSPRLARDGKPVCSGVVPPTYTSGDFKRGSNVPDPN
jgi:hypothetical protein